MSMFCRSGLNCWFKPRMYLMFCELCADLISFFVCLIFIHRLFFTVQCARLNPFMEIGDKNIYVFIRSSVVPVAVQSHSLWGSNSKLNRGLDPLCREEALQHLEHFPHITKLLPAKAAALMSSLFLSHLISRLSDTSCDAQVASRVPGGGGTTLQTPHKWTSWWKNHVIQFMIFLNLNVWYDHFKKQMLLIFLSISVTIQIHLFYSNGATL